MAEGTVFGLEKTAVQWGVFENLKELFPVVELQEGQIAKGFFMVSSEFGTDSLTDSFPKAFEIKKYSDPLYTSPSEDDIYDSLEFCFGDATLEKTPYEGKYSVERAGNRIAANTRRGTGKTIYKDYIFYHGPSAFDKIAQIFKDHEGTYSLFVHPKFSNYVERIVLPDETNEQTN